MTKRAFRAVEQCGPSYPSWSTLAPRLGVQAACGRRVFLAGVTGVVGAALLAMLGGTAEASSSRRKPPTPPPKKKPKRVRKRKSKRPPKKRPIQFDGSPFMAPAPIDIER